MKKETCQVIDRKELEGEIYYKYLFNILAVQTTSW